MAEICFGRGVESRLRRDTGRRCIRVPTQDVTDCDLQVGTARKTGKCTSGRRRLRPSLPSAREQSVAIDALDEEERGTLLRKHDSAEPTGR